MKKLLLTVTLIAMLASLAEAQQVPDPRVADLVQAGKIQVGVHSVMYTKDPRTGELKGASVGIVFLDIVRTLGARIGVEVLPIGHPTIPEMLTCLTTGACDMGFMGPDPSRQGVDFSPPILQLDYTFLVPAGSSIQRIADADRPDVRIAVVRDHASTLTLSRMFKHAQLIYAATPDPTCVGQRCAFGIFPKASRLAGAGGSLRGQPRRDGGAEGSSRAARLPQRVHRTCQVLGIGAAGHRARRLART
jgi:ABC-type amino acid transport substrate-binding protein